LARTSKDETPHTTVGIDESLQVGKKLGNPLDFIKDRAIRSLLQKGTRIFMSEGTSVRVFQREVGQFRSKKS
jgi:hypothetical protein